MSKLYRLTFEDNNSVMTSNETISGEKLSSAQRVHYDWMYAENGSIHHSLCETCGSKKSFDYVNPDFKLKRGVYDLSITYDGYLIASQRFKDFCVRKDFSGIQFERIRHDVSFYILRINNVLHLNESKMTHRKTNFCSSCNEYSSIVKPGTLHFSENIDEVENSLFESNIHFGSSHEKHPLILATSDIVDEFAIEGFKGYYINEV
ncbi:hypothetical protein EHQ53_01150 [Leptospira langatensis]|uniref:Uncharacterized protein n=1 Tax=Leptospira langatensis TaxID=2484983 RepID=A0A5F1ZWU5_9LEPT|nr:hypothetical protein [Leptospira langatensis]TGJ98362.1 hypothetical protein EHO57_17290 [Leptospira langatensis]TGL43276.1 hypothetical protein EHQ53_01150 [Leptospira langatensis]